ncbi:MAG: ABC transporter permease [Candidatus Hodarchaeota archaeon]
MLRFAAKNAFRRKSIAILALIGVAIGVSLMTAMASLSATITDQTNTFAQANLDSIRVQQLGQLYYNSRFNLTKSYNVTQIDHIDAYSAQVIQQVIVAGGSAFNPQLVGVSIENDTATDGVTSKISRGRVFQNGKECIISEATANWVDLEIGDELPFITPSLDWCNLTIVGVYEGFTFFGIISVYTTLETARQFKTDFGNDTYSILLIKSDIPANVKNIADEIDRISEEENLGLEAVLPEEQLEIATEFTGTINIVVLAISVIAGVAGGMSIVVAMLMSVIERMKEFATLKATGWQNIDVVKDIMYESLIVTIAGGVVGFALGLIFLQLVQLLAAVVLNPLRPSIFLQIALFVIVMGIIGGIYPAYKVSKTSPVEILRGE